LKQKDEIIRQQTSKLNASGIKLENMPTPANPLATQENSINVSLAAQGNPNPNFAGNQIPNANQNIFPQNNPPTNNLAYNSLNGGIGGMNNFGNNQNMIPLNQMNNNFMPDQMGNYNPGNMVGFGANTMNPMMPMQPGMIPFNSFSQQKKNLREVL